MIQIIEQTEEEKIAMYMKCTKKELISMLRKNQKLLAQRTYFTVNYPNHLEPPWKVT